MPLVSYSDSESDSVENTSVPHKRAHNGPDIAGKKKQKKPSLDLPPLPAEFRNLYATNVRVSTHDDPSLHGGRKRVIPHTPGHWPSHLQLECTSYTLGRIHLFSSANLEFRVSKVR